MNQLTIASDFSVQNHILLLIEKRDEKGFRLLYKTYWQHLVNYTSSIVKEKYIAEEIVQNLLVSFYTKRIILKNKSSLLTYLYKSIRNRVLNYYRDQNIYNKYITSKNSDIAASTNVIMDALHLIDLQNEIKHCLSKLQWKYAEVYLLSREHLLTIKEISKQLNRPEGTIEKQLRKALQYLKDNISDSFLTPS
jgi:RNA polymerase sigma-70 factor (ECF subfamily)